MTLVHQIKSQINIWNIYLVVSWLNTFKNQEIQYFILVDMTDKPDDLEDGLKHNPWSVETVEQFLYYNCPECDNKTQSKTIFINHAYLNHPRVSKNE